LRDREQRFGLSLSQDQIDVLCEARRVLNTECDCIIQTSQRIIVVECKDKTEFDAEQTQRQRSRLIPALRRLLRRPEPAVYLELSAKQAGSDTNNPWSWSLLTDLPARRSAAHQ
jgi:hypothetical protein